MTAQEKIATFYDLDPLDAEMLPVTHAEWIKCMDEYAQQQVNEYKTLLDRAANLVGNPGTNISSSTDIAAENWQKDYEAFKKLNP